MGIPVPAVGVIAGSANHRRRAPATASWRSHTTIAESSRTLRHGFDLLSEVTITGD
jgi:hypothetical protein